MFKEFLIHYSISKIANLLHNISDNSISNVSKHAYQFYYLFLGAQKYFSSFLEFSVGWYGIILRTSWNAIPVSYPLKAL